MKVTTLFSLVLAISLSASVNGQNGAELSQVTLYLYSTFGHNYDSSRSSINFETGKRGYIRGSESPRDFDLIYGGLAMEKDGKWFPDWLMVRDSRSMIVDLGKKTWEEFKETPAFPRNKKPLPPLRLANRPIVINSSAGSKDHSPYKQLVQPKTGHMFLMRLLHGNKVIYVMFRVEALNPWDSCVLSWKKVAPPKVVDEK